MTTEVLGPAEAQAATRVRAARLVAAGAVCGLAWAAGLRGFMVQVAGPDSAVDWLGTFEGILLPGAVTGGLLGWARHRRRGWLAAAPLAFVLATPTVLVSIVTDGGIGGGAVALPLFGIAGGFALSGRGPRWARVLAGAFAALPGPAWAAGAGLIRPGLAVTDPRGAWVAVLLASAVAVLAMACSVPLRAAPLGGRPGRAAPLVAAGAVCGLAWAAGLRGFMAALAGPFSDVSWFGTFGAILLPGAVVGALLGWAEHQRRTGGRHRRRLAFAPLAFGVLDPPVAVVGLLAMAGGYALAGRGSRWARAAAATAAVLPAPAYVITVTLLGDAAPAVTTPRGAWLAALVLSFLAVLALAAAIPHRPAPARGG